MQQRKHVHTELACLSDMIVADYHKTTECLFFFLSISWHWNVTELQNCFRYKLHHTHCPNSDRTRKMCYFCTTSVVSGYMIIPSSQQVHHCMFVCKVKSISFLYRSSYTAVILKLSAPPPCVCCISLWPPRVISTPPHTRLICINFLR